ncbi:hypothetical protein [Shewanella sp. YLB-07]|uniref:hypothetical protein n=1 Tax=Shewanella sp. YLB-07 TaxID=2601268 RepID=UPI00128D08A7|nr:hypothetical protein [Shewanella sp. YLB-07]MPY24474.1 hypothetical protein [Shewanella sp. YLB-07]
MLFKLFFTLGAFFLIQGCTSLQTLQSETWTKAESNNFTLYSKQGEVVNRFVLERLEMFSQLINNSNLHYGFNRFPTDIYMMNQEEGKLFGISRNISGYFDNRLNKNIIYLRYDREIEKMLSTIFHEYVHNVHAEMQLSLPRWLEEGTAEYLSGVEISDNTLTLGAVQHNRWNWLRDHRWLPASKIINPDFFSDFDGDNISMFYAQSWFLVFYLNNRPLPDGIDYSIQLKSYLNHLKNGKGNVLAFEEAFGLKISQVNNTLVSYREHGKFNKKIINTKNILETIHIKSSVLSPGETNIILAEFSVSRKETSNALFFFEKATNLLIQKDTALVGKAKAYIFDNQLDKAKVLLNFVEDSRQSKKSEFYLTKALYNQALAKQEKSKSRKINLVERALVNLDKAWKLDKGNSSIYYYYGLIEITYGIEIEKAARMIEEAIYYNPANIQLKLMLVKVKILTGDEQTDKYTRNLLADLNSEYHLYAVDLLIKLTNFTSDYHDYIDRQQYKSWAVSSNGTYGYAYGKSNQNEADEAAVLICMVYSKEGGCQVIDRGKESSDVFNEWFKLQVLNIDNDNLRS